MLASSASSLQARPAPLVASLRRPAGPQRAAIITRAFEKDSLSDKAFNAVDNAKKQDQETPRIPGDTIPNPFNWAKDGREGEPSPFAEVNDPNVERMRQSSWGKKEEGEGKKSGETGNAGGNILGKSGNMTDAANKGAVKGGRAAQAVGDAVEGAKGKAIQAGEAVEEAVDGAKDAARRGLGAVASNVARGTENLTSQLTSGEDEDEVVWTGAKEGAPHGHDADMPSSLKEQKPNMVSDADTDRPLAERQGDRGGADWDEVKGAGTEKRRDISKKGVDVARERAAELDDWTGN